MCSSVRGSKSSSGKQEDMRKVPLGHWSTEKSRQSDEKIKKPLPKRRPRRRHSKDRKAGETPVPVHDFCG